MPILCKFKFFKLSHFFILLHTSCISSCIHDFFFMFSLRFLVLRFERRKIMAKESHLLEAHLGRWRTLGGFIRFKKIQIYHVISCIYVFIKHLCIFFLNKYMYIYLWLSKRWCSHGLQGTCTRQILVFENEMNEINEMNEMKGLEWKMKRLEWNEFKLKRRGTKWVERRVESRPEAARRASGRGVTCPVAGDIWISTSMYWVYISIISIYRIFIFLYIMLPVCNIHAAFQQ